jgi:hypothetical protein
LKFRERIRGIPNLLSLSLYILVFLAVVEKEEKNSIFGLGGPGGMQRRTKEFLESKLQSGFINFYS